MPIHRGLGLVQEVGPYCALQHFQSMWRHKMLRTAVSHTAGRAARWIPRGLLRWDLLVSEEHLRGLCHVGRGLEPDARELIALR